MEIVAKYWSLPRQGEKKEDCLETMNETALKRSKYAKIRSDIEDNRSFAARIIVLVFCKLVTASLACF